MTSVRDSDAKAAVWTAGVTALAPRLSSLEHQRHAMAQARRAEAREPRGLVARFPRFDLEAWFGFGLFLNLLFLPQFKTAGAALVVVCVAAYLIFRRRQVLAAIRPRAFLFIPPIMALTSSLWSEAPWVSLQQGLEYAVTVLAALLLSATPRPGALLKALFGAFMIYLLISLALGGKVAVGMTGGEAFSGLNGGKNLIADIAATGAFISVGVGLGPNRRHRLFWGLAALLAIALEVYVVIAAKSAGAVLGLLAGMATLAVLLVLTAAGKVARGALMVMAAILAGAGLLAYQWISAGLIGTGASLFGKDSTLTGRTYLWYRAHDLIVVKPMLGMGYSAFWRQGDIDAEGLWRYAGITERGGFTFHNTLIELLVQMGVVGAVVVIGVAVAGAALMLRRVLRRPSIAFCCFAALLVYNMARMPIESVGLSPFYFSTVILFMAFGSAVTVEAPRQGAPSGAPVLADVV